MTKREAILAAMKAKLVSVTGVTDANVFRSRAEAITRARGSSIVIEPIQDVPDNSTLSILTWALTTRVTVIVRGDIPDQIADPIIESLHSKLMSDLSLGGLSMDIQPAPVSFEILEGDQPIGIISLDYRVQYRTGVESLS
jgi:hypothetical protein